MIRKYQKDMRPYSERKDYYKIRYSKNRDYYLQKIKKSNQRLRIEVLTHYSNGTLKCNCPECDECNPKFLTLDHVNNNGKEDRKRFNSNTNRLLRWLRRNGYPEGYQVLCYNCNQGKDKNGGICPHLEELN
jgi:hypothetical protein